MRAHKLCLYIIVSGLVFFPAVFDNCSIHDPERNHQWELMSVPVRLALLRGGAGTGAARSCNACTRVPAAGSRLGVGGGEESGQAWCEQVPADCSASRAARACPRAGSPGRGPSRAPRARRSLAGTLLPGPALSPLPAGRLTMGFAAVLLFVKGREGVKVAPRKDN